MLLHENVVSCKTMLAQNNCNNTFKLPFNLTLTVAQPTGFGESLHVMTLTLVRNAHLSVDSKCHFYIYLFKNCSNIKLHTIF